MLHSTNVMGRFQQIQEAGLPFYGYAILTHALIGGERRIFLSLFWTLIFVIVTLSLTALVLNTRFLVEPGSPVSAALVKIGIGYFVSIALAECLSAGFLLRKFRNEHKSAVSSPLSGGKLYCHIMRSTTMRVTVLASIGVSRAVTTALTSKTHKLDDTQYRNVVGQLDMLVYMMSCFFPTVIL